MIVERLPEVQKLDADEKLQLVAELLEETTDLSPEEPDPEVVRILQERMEEYRRDPSLASPWSEVKKRLLRHAKS